jgi:GT2 family glycosyltransferase
MTRTPPIALVLCTHNPEPRCLQRCLKSLVPLLARHPQAELILVDNHSSPPLADSEPVQNLLATLPQARLVVESRQGLCWARQRGVQSCTAPWVLFLDDDNEVAPDYLDVLLAGIDRFHDVAAWGPGVIDVEFLDPVAEEVAAHPEWFQQRRQPLAYGCHQASWDPWYPNGTGFAIRTDVLEAYGQKLASGTLSATGRNGTSMASAEDVQIVWEAIRRGLAAGLLPDLRLTHLIPGRKTSREALQRHAFGVSSSYFPALLESWPEEAERLPPVPTYGPFLRRLLRLKLKQVLVASSRFRSGSELGGLLGYAVGLSAAHKDPRHRRYLRWARGLGLC